MRLIVSEEQGRPGASSYRGSLPEQVARASRPGQPSRTTSSWQTLRWHLEDYLSALRQRRALGAEAHPKSADSGQEPVRAAHSAWASSAATPTSSSRDCQEWELWIASKTLAFLGLPWGADVRSGEGFFEKPWRSRWLGSTAKCRIAPALRGRGGRPGPFLMVIARPRGIKDAGYRAVAWPSSPEARGGRRKVEVSSPAPTFPRVKPLLAEAPARITPHHILQFWMATVHLGDEARREPDPLEVPRRASRGNLASEGAADAERLVSAAHSARRSTRRACRSSSSTPVDSG